MNGRRFHSLVRVAVGAAALFGGLLVTRSGRADGLAPDYIRQRYNLPCTPECTLCHATSPGNFGNIRYVTVNGQKRAFAYSLRGCGFVPDDPGRPAAWDAQFQACEMKPVAELDTDGDGVQDMEELKDGTDPSDPSPGAQICGTGPTYGCVRVARGTSVDGMALLTSGAVLFAGIALTRRRRR